VPPRNFSRSFRRAGPAIALGLLLLVGSISVWQAWVTSRHLKDEARATSRIFGQVVAALTDTTAGTTDALLDLVAHISETGIPLVVADFDGDVLAGRNLPFGDDLDDPALPTFVAGLAEYSDPIEVPGVGRIFFGPIPASGRLSWLPILQLFLLFAAVAAGVLAYRAAVGRDRDRLWVAMARESAHQLGTPLMSARAWIDRLSEGNSDTGTISENLLADVERLERVAQRFERIGRPARKDRVALGALAERTAHYFEPRLPKRANLITLNVIAPSAGPMVSGDPVLLGWALESLVKNSIDALSGRGGLITISVAGEGNMARLVVEDDGPGIDPEVRSGIFDPGVTTKMSGWGIGLALTRRIIEEVNEGRFELMDNNVGAKFVAELTAGKHAKLT
jgi:signal transduction histidine kinase